LVLLFISPAFAQLTTTTLLPNSYVTTHGSDNGTPVSALDVLDESGLVSNSTEFVQFKAKSAGATYTGYRTYNLPKSIHAGSISQIRLLVNYRGPMSSTKPGPGRSSTGSTAVTLPWVTTSLRHRSARGPSSILI
jgi:hypothetical protein